MRVPEPALVEGRVDAARGDELIVPPALDDPASIEDEHDVGALRGREPVRDGYGRPPPRAPPPRRRALAPLADRRVQPLGETANPPVKTEIIEGTLDVLVGRVLAPVADVLPDRGVEEETVLGHHTERARSGPAR